MKHRVILALVLVFQILGLTAVWAAETKLTPDQQQLLEKLSLLREVWQRKITLEYLADKRTADYFEKLIADFPKKLQANFRENIKGNYRAEFFANYADKSDELIKQSFKAIADKPANDALLAAVLKQSSFPLNLAYQPLVRQISERRVFQAANANDAKTKEAYQKLAEFWKKHSDDLLADAKKDRYAGVQELYAKVSIKEFPLHWYDDAQHDTTFETEGDTPTPPAPTKKKIWTFLMYICADNDLERFGLQDVNEMEKVGSSDKVNIVVQIDRMKGGKGDSIADGNWVGTRRYFVEKDNDVKKVHSPMVQNLGEVDMGNKHTLADFLKWGVTTYPAENVAVVIWNHGAGWLGVASDEESGNMLRLQDVSWALREGQKALSDVNGKKSKFAIVDFDACLMGTIEVAYELAEMADYMVASEETEPGTGMPYADYLEPITRNPALSPAEVTKRMVGTYVYSYARGGSATNPVIQGSAVTKSAIDLNKLEGLVKLFNKLGKQLLDNHDLYAELLVNEAGQLASVRRYSDETLVDIVDFALKLGEIEDLPKAIKETCDDIVKLIGYPVANDKLAKPVTISSPEPGVVVWGYNDWRMPPKDLWPSGTRVFRSRLAMTPLRKGPNGGYYCVIGPFQPVIDEALEKKVWVDQIDYQIYTQSGKAGEKRSVKQGKEYLIVSRFPKESPMVIEGHTQGMGDSRGLSIYYPAPLKFDNAYRATRFARETKWAEFIGKIPTFRRKADILLTGQMVEDPMTLPLLAKALKANKVKFQILWDPSVFGYDYKKILSQFVRSGAVITDSMSSSSMGQLSPSSADLIEYLDQGGSLLVAAQSFERVNVHQKLLKDYFRFTYVDDEKDLDELTWVGRNGQKNSFTLNGDDSAKTASDITIMKATAPAKLFVTLSDGRGAGIAVNAQGAGNKTYSAVYLGFRFEAVSGEDTRTALMSEILDRLYPERHQGTLFD